MFFENIKIDIKKGYNKLALDNILKVLNDIIFNNENFYENELEFLDKVLNSPYIINIEEIKSILRKNKIYE